MSYQIFITPENDRLLVEAFECLLAHTSDPNKREKITIALIGINLARPTSWETPYNIWQGNCPCEVNNVIHP